MFTTIISAILALLKAIPVVADLFEKGQRRREQTAKDAAVDAGIDRVLRAKAEQQRKTDGAPGLSSGGGVSPGMVSGRAQDDQRA